MTNHQGCTILMQQFKISWNSECSCSIIHLLRLQTWSVSIKWNYQHVHHQLEVVNKTYSNHWKILDLSLIWPTKTSEAFPTLGSWLIFERITDQRNQTKTPVASSHGALASRTQCTQRHGAGQGRIGAQTFRGPKDWKDQWSKHTTGQVFFAKAWPWAAFWHHFFLSAS